MARSKPKSGPVSTLKEEKLDLAQKPELILKDFRISKILSERFLPPEDARIGTYSVNSAAKQAIFPENLEVSRNGKLTYSVTLIGFTRPKTEDTKQSKEKSFSIEIEAEGLFYAVGDFNVDDEAFCAIALRPIILLVHGICIHHARAEADSMGYRTVRPDYQAKNMPDPVLEAE